MDEGEPTQPAQIAGDPPLTEADIDMRAPFGAGAAFAILGGHLATQFVVSAAVLLCVPIIAGVVASRRGVPSDRMVAYLESVVQDVGLPLALILAFLFSVVVMLILALALVRRAPHPTFAEAVGWRTGTVRQLRYGTVIGLMLGLLYAVTATYLLPLPENAELGPLARMAMEGGIHRLLWAVLAIACAPPVEEFLYRGVLYTGTARSWGVPTGAVVTCVIFAALHLTEVQYYWPALPFVIALAVAVQVLRIRTGCIGPGIMLHAAYNGILVFLMYVSG